MIVKSLVIQGLFPETITSLNAFREVIKLVGNLGWYDAVEFSYTGPDRDFSEIKKILETWKLKPVLLTAGYRLKTEGYDPGSTDATVREDALDVIKEEVDHALELNAGRVVVLSGPNPGRLGASAALSRTVETFQKACAYADRQAGERKLTVSMENFDTKPPTSLLIGSTPAAIGIIQAVRQMSDRFELTFDLSHVLQLRETPEKALKLAKPYIGHIHLANCIIHDLNNPLYGDFHPPFGFDGGCVDEPELTSFMQIVKIIMNYKERDVIVGHEIILPDGGDAVSIVKETTSQMQRAFEKNGLS